MHPNTSVQLMDTVSNSILHSNHCDANTVFVKFMKALMHTAAVPRGGSLNAKFTL